jgi:hypothetical protein
MKGANAAVDHAHDQATGIDPALAEHHFELAKDGGSIRLETREASATELRERIRGHLREIAAAFAAGDFKVPERIHGRVPPGVPVLKARKDRIEYDYAATERGGTVRIRTADAEALDAVHAFLRFQVEDHRTGDATE